MLYDVIKLMLLMFDLLSIMMIEIHLWAEVDFRYNAVGSRIP